MYAVNFQMEEQHKTIALTCTQEERYVNLSVSIPYSRIRICEQKLRIKCFSIKSRSFSRLFHFLGVSQQQLQSDETTSNLGMFYFCSISVNDSKISCNECSGILISSRFYFSITTALFLPYF